MPKRKGITQYFSIGTIGLHLVSGVVVGVLIGYYLDKFFNTSPWLTIIFFFFGLAAGFRNMYKDVQRYIVHGEDFENLEEKENLSDTTRTDSKKS
ncbi:AtpZ/AtpI family protein [Persephonella sp. KM09-Lau-8]|uniref:AtpZ/AtpI family protein n=1 Tax=Persephonella sp. KM09-Lau-8 TaxID=1158345 RepID=UPI000494EFD9|nr:AtpZ/AtpI family protein [Persephonella sp. KM09-Lau-8]